MISPLNVQRMVLHQTVHNEMRSRSTVKNISQDMKVIDNKTLDQLCQGYDEILRTADLNDRIYDRIIISFFVQDFCLLRDQFLDHISIICRQCLADFGSGIFGCSGLADFDQTVQRDLVPIFHIFFYLFDQTHLFFRIVDKRSQRTLVTVA